MSNFFWFPIEELPFIVLSIILCFTIHEFAHAFTAWKFGDDTAYKEGRVTLNPVAHLDFLGFIFIILAGFGWAKPVPVRASRFSNPRLMSVIVSAAGPVSNFLLGVLSFFLLFLLYRFGLVDGASDGVRAAIETFFGYFIHFNFLLFVFNLIPLPPLDGYRIVMEFLPLNLRFKIEQHAQWGVIIFLLLVFIPPLRAVTIGPILGWTENITLFVGKLVSFVI
ncbi:zinc metalloprotease [Paenibacillus oryzae]|uniref:Zinc metalloprotease n=1 Tax=Paenibacillus oryzae TaxID=1844972 RepID=A0A1A5YBY7_9BACL|nr:zinc metalloprotease [Paenibacillus oryzae]